MTKRTKCVPGLERVNYFNGQRLDAADLRAEQDYHIDVRRRITEALFTPGIAQGLDVVAPKFDPGEFDEAERDANVVRVTPGLALDGYGRAIVLSQATVMPVPGLQGADDRSLPKLYLTVRYGRELASPSPSVCGQPGPPTPGSPSRIRSTACLEFLALPPSDADLERVTLAELWLDTECRIFQVARNVREHVNVAARRGTRPLTLEGEKDIDRYNPKVIVFHVSNERPSSVILYLRGRQFSTLHYTELARHAHGLGEGSGLSGRDQPVDADGDPIFVGGEPRYGHAHGTTWDSVSPHRLDLVSQRDGTPTTESETIGAAPHGHTFDAAVMVSNHNMTGSTIGTHLIVTDETGLDKAGADPSSYGIDFDLSTLAAQTHQPILSVTATTPDASGGAGHVHDVEFANHTPWIGALTIDVSEHKHEVLTSIVEIGQEVAAVRGLGELSDPLAARDTATPLTYLDDLQVYIDGHPVTEQLVEMFLRGAWSSLVDEDDLKLGNGEPGHPLNTDVGIHEYQGTPALELHLLDGVDFGPNQAHTVELRVDNDSGGCIQYSLYVE